MNKVKKIFLVLLVVVLVTGCGITKKDNDNQKVEDQDVIALLNNHMANLTAIPKTVELLKQPNFKADSYTNDDMLYMGLYGALNSQLAVNYNRAQINALKAKGYTATSYIKEESVESVVQNVFGSVNVKSVAEITGCPSYKYYEAEKIYLVNESCTNAQDYLAMMVDTITYDGNIYKVNAYLTLVSGNKVYKDINKTNEFKTLNNGETFTIDASNKDSFAKYTFTFTKNSDGKYVFTNAKKK